MNIVYQIYYNKRQAKKYEWSPSTFGFPLFAKINAEFITAVERFQKEHDLEVDGLVGPLTYRRLMAERMQDGRDLGHYSTSASLERYVKPTENKGFYIFCGGEKVPIDAEVKFDFLEKGFKFYKKDRNPTMIVTHWDVTTQPATTKKILERRSISTHFVIDGDGTIYQLVDCNNAAWHAGIRKVNNASIGIDLNTAYYLKYQKHYEKREGKPRPVIEDARVHGSKLKPFIGFTEEQLKAYEVLLATLSKVYDIPLKVPVDRERNLITKVHKSAKKAKFKGTVCHYHLTRGKIDVAGLDLVKHIDNAKEL